jgi:hypothetical protein
LYEILFVFGINLSCALRTRSKCAIAEQKEGIVRGNGCIEARGSPQNHCRKSTKMISIPVLSRGATFPTLLDREDGL